MSSVVSGTQTPPVSHDLSSVQAAIAALQQKMAQRQQEHIAQIKMMSLEAQARQAGLADLDFLRLPDFAKATYEPQGLLKNGRALFAQIQKDKPYLFVPKAPRGGSSIMTDLVKPSAPRPIDMLTLSPAEYAAEKKARGW